MAKRIMILATNGFEQSELEKPKQNLEDAGFETVVVSPEAGEIKGTIHASIGQEAVSVGVCQALERTDVAYSGHRCHGEYLAKGGSLLGMFAEL